MEKKGINPTTPLPTPNSPLKILKENTYNRLDTYIYIYICVHEGSPQIGYPVCVCVCPCPCLSRRNPRCLPGGAEALASAGSPHCLQPLPMAVWLALLLVPAMAVWLALLLVPAMAVPGHLRPMRCLPWLVPAMAVPAMAVWLALLLAPAMAVPAIALQLVQPMCWQLVAVVAVGVGAAAAPLLPPSSQPASVFAVAGPASSMPQASPADDPSGSPTQRPVACSFLPAVCWLRLQPAWPAALGCCHAKRPCCPGCR